MPHIKSYCRYQGQRLAWLLTGSHNTSKAAWGNLESLGPGASQLRLWHFELSVLLLPRLEAAYRRHPHRAFSCTAGWAEPGPCVASGRLGWQQEVEFWTVAQQLEGGSQQGQQAGGLRLHLPLPYRLPPTRYTAEDRPWAVDVCYEQLRDSWGALHYPGRYWWALSKRRRR